VSAVDPLDDIVNMNSMNALVTHVHQALYALTYTMGKLNITLMVHISV